jgi:Ca2+-binding EF-hand superfamily protein
VINFDTFLKVLMRPDGFKPAGTYNEFINGFKVFDKENDGCITVGELRSGMVLLTLLLVCLCMARVDC